MNQSSFPVFLISLMLLGSADVFAQENRSDTLSAVLEPIRVEATHSSITLEEAAISVTRSVRSERDMVARRASTMDEITFNLPGIWINNRENHALGERMTVRGMGWRSQFGVRGIQVIMDDIPLTVADGQTILNMVDPAMIQSIELLRGPSATFWGNSSGGVLYLRTQPDPEAPRFRYRTFFGSYNTMKHEARFTDQLDGIQLNAYGTYHRSDGYRNHNSSELIRGGISAGFNFGENTRIVARAAYSGMPYAEHPGSLLKEEIEQDPTLARDNFVNANAGKEFHQWMGTVNLYQGFEAGMLSVIVHNTYRDFRNPLPFAYIEVDRYAGGARTTFDFDMLPFDLQMGAEIKTQRDDRLERNNVGGDPGDDISFDQFEIVNNQAIFSQATFSAGALTFSAGLRADRMTFRADDRLGDQDGSTTFTTLNPSLGAVYKFGTARLFGNISTSFESPTTTEFKNRPGNETGFNHDLKPEKTVGFETGVRGFFEKLNLEYDLTVFQMRVNDLIIDEGVDAQGRSYFGNEGNSRHNGVETRLQFHPFQDMSIILTYTLLNLEFRDGEFEGNKIPGVTPNRLAASVVYSSGPHHLGFDFEWVDQYYTNSSNTAVNDAYPLLNGRWMFDTFGNETWSLQPFVSVNNILNTRYNTSVAINAFGGRYYEPGSERNFQAGISLNFY